MIAYDDLRISFRKTDKLPTHVMKEQPPTHDSYTLFPITKYNRRLPIKMVTDSGVMLTMAQKEGMLITFQSIQPYIIKIYVGNISAITGEPIQRDSVSDLSRRTKIRKKWQIRLGSPLQDYIHVPLTKRLDGYTDAKGRLTRFAPTSYHGELGVWEHIDQDIVPSRLRFEITPYRMPATMLPGGKRGDDYVSIEIRTPTDPIRIPLFAADASLLTLRWELDKLVSQDIMKDAEFEHATIGVLASKRQSASSARVAESRTVGSLPRESNGTILLTLNTALWCPLVASDARAAPQLLDAAQYWTHGWNHEKRVVFHAYVLSPLVSRTILDTPDVSAVSAPLEDLMLVEQRLWRKPMSKRDQVSMKVWDADDDVEELEL